MCVLGMASKGTRSMFGERSHSLSLFSVCVLSVSVCSRGRGRRGAARLGLCYPCFFRRRQKARCSAGQGAAWQGLLVLGLRRRQRGPSPLVPGRCSPAAAWLDRGGVLLVVAASPVTLTFARPPARPPGPLRVTVPRIIVSEAKIVTKLVRYSVFPRNAIC